MDDCQRGGGFPTLNSHSLFPIPLGFALHESHTYIPASHQRPPTLAPSEALCRRPTMLLAGRCWHPCCMCNHGGQPLNQPWCQRNHAALVLIFDDPGSAVGCAIDSLSLSPQPVINDGAGSDDDDASFPGALFSTSPRCSLAPFDAPHRARLQARSIKLPLLSPSTPSLDACMLKICVCVQAWAWNPV